MRFFARRGELLEIPGDGGEQLSLHCLYQGPHLKWLWACSFTDFSTHTAIPVIASALSGNHCNGRQIPFYFGIQVCITAAKAISRF